MTSLGLDFFGSGTFKGPAPEKYAGEKVTKIREFCNRDSSGNQAVADEVVPGKRVISMFWIPPLYHSAWDESLEGIKYFGLVISNKPTDAINQNI